MDWRAVRDGLIAYEQQDKSLRMIGVETLIISFGVGVGSKSLEVGIITFLIASILWFIPIIGTIMSVVCSLVYGYIAYAIANIVGLSIVLCVVLGIFVFLGRLGAHFVVQ